MASHLGSSHGKKGKTFHTSKASNRKAAMVKSGHITLPSYGPHKAIGTVSMGRRESTEHASLHRSSAGHKSPRR